MILDQDPILSINLRRIRSSQKLSQVELASRAGVSRIGYRNIEDGESEPKAATLTAIARALGVPIEQLRALIADLGELSEADAVADDFIDLGETRAFEVVDGEGECAS